MSVRAFETDVNVGGTKGDCPPEYDSVEWHLYQAMIGKDIVGAAIIFPDETNSSVYIGRVFIDSSADIGVVCYSLENGKWVLNADAVRPDHIICKYDK